MVREHHSLKRFGVKLGPMRVTSGLLRALYQEGTSSMTLQSLTKLNLEGEFYFIKLTVNEKNHLLLLFTLLSQA